MTTARALGKIGQKAEAAVEPLIRSMKTWDGEGITYVPMSLHEIGEPALTPLLRIVLGQDTEEHDGTRGFAASALRHIFGTGADVEPGRSIVDPLIAALEDGNEQGHAQATSALDQNHFESSP